MGKKIISLFLVMCVLLTSIPMTVFAGADDILYGDVNSDKTVDLKDVLDFKKHMADYEISFDETAGDVNNDKTLDLKDLLLIKKYLAGWEVNLGPELCTITFNADGGSEVAPIQVRSGYTIEKEPKTEKQGYLFAGWFTESGEQFYAKDPILSSMTLTARYEEMDSTRNLSLTTFTKMDQAPDLSYIVKGEGLTAEQVEEMVTLQVIDGNDLLELKVVDNGDGTFTISAVDGFLEGGSYTLTLGEGLNFADKDESIRTASFTIAKEEVAKLALNDDVVYIEDTEEMKYVLDDGTTVDVLELALLNNETTNAVKGTFQYDGEVAVGDTLCIFETVDPRERNVIEKTYEDDSVAYVKVTAINGKSISFTSVDSDSVKDILFIPDTIPFKVASMPTEKTGTLKTTDYDTAAWAQMGFTVAPKFDVGDFVVIYTVDFDKMTEKDAVYYSEVTAIEGETISYKEIQR